MLQGPRKSGLPLLGRTKRKDKAKRSIDVTLQQNAPEKKLQCPYDNLFYCILDSGNFLQYQEIVPIDYMLKCSCFRRG